MNQILKHALQCSIAVLAFTASVYSLANDSTNAFTTSQLLSISNGMRVKCVWDRYLTKGNPTDQLGPNHALVVFDTDEKRERVLQSTPASYDYPIITHDGTRVIWNDMANGEAWICNWDGSGKTLLLKGDTIANPGFISSTRWDSLEKKEYVYAGIANANRAGCDLGRCGDVVNTYIYSFPLAGLALDNAQKKVVWDGTKAGGTLCTATYFQVSADGLFATGQPTNGANCLGYLDLAAQSIVETRLSGAGPLGCRPNGAPDNSRRWLHLMAGHSWIHMYKYGGADNSLWARPDSMYPASMGIWSYGGLECPRWSNHVRYITGGASMALPGWSWDQASFNWEFYLERFDANFTKVEKIIQVSHASNQQAEYSGQAWFDMGSSTEVNFNHLSPSIRKMSHGVHEGVAFDIQGRRIAPSSIWLNGTHSAGSQGIRIENGKIQAMLY
jgi:hypothetical protein